jgi:uncharacterized BrkB/YihY/UPF0761 family membrane protein
VSQPGEGPPPPPRLTLDQRARAWSEVVRQRAPGWMVWAKEHVPGLELLFAALIREAASGGVLIAGGLAFRFFLWLVPVGLLGATILSYWVSLDQEGLSDVASEFGIGAASMKTAAQAVEASQTSRGVLLGVALGLTLWFSLGAVRALVLAFSLAWRLEPARLAHPLRAVAFFDGVVLFVSLSPLALAWLREQIGLGGLVGAVVSLALSTALVILVMWVLPRRAERWQELLPGAALVAVGAEIIHVAVVFYFAPKLERSSELYGALGTAAAILLWLYFSARLVSIGAFLNATLWDRRHCAPSEAEPAAPAAAPATSAQASIE